MNTLIKYLAYPLTTNYLCAKLFSFHLRFLSFFSLSSVEPRNYSSKELRERWSENSFSAVSVSSLFYAENCYRLQNSLIEIMVAFHKASLVVGSWNAMNNQIAFSFQPLFNDFIQRYCSICMFYVDRFFSIHLNQKTSIKIDSYKSVLIL